MFVSPCQPTQEPITYVPIASVLYDTYSPAPPLSNFVDQFWYVQRGSSEHGKEGILPTGTIELVINLSGDSPKVHNPQAHDQVPGSCSSLVSGPHSGLITFDTAPDSCLLGVHFKPGGAFPFFKLPLGQLRNSVVSLDTLWGGKAAGLRDLLFEAKVPAKFHILEQFLIREAVRSCSRRGVVAYALSRFHGVHQGLSIERVTEQIGLSKRRFIQIFNNEVGLTPKLFCRIRRFQKALRQIERSATLDWTEIALAAGYFDQAHFIHDFKEFSGFSPTAFAANGGERANHISIRR